MAAEHATTARLAVFLRTNVPEDSWAEEGDKDKDTAVICSVER